MSVGRDAEGAFVRAEAAAVGEVVVLRALRRRAVACEVRAVGTMRVCRVEGTLATARLRSIYALACMSATEILARHSILR